MKHIRAWLLRVGGLFTVSRRDRELGDELASHLQMHIDDNIRAGMTPADARRHALVRLGGISSVREQYRERGGVPVLQHIAQDVRYGARMLRRSPAFTLVAVLTLGLGIGANTAIFSVVNAVLLRPLPFPDSRRLVLIWATNEKSHDREDVASYPDFLEWRSTAKGFDDMAAFTTRPVGVAGGAQTELVEGLQVSPSFFDVLGVRVAVGRPFGQGDDEDGAARVAILSDAAWKRHFGGRGDVVGQPIRANDELYTIVGVMPPDFRFIQAGPEQIYLPLGRDPSRSHGFLRVIGRLGPGVSVRNGQAEMDVIAARIAAAYPKSNAGVGSNVVPLVEAMAGPARTPLLIFLGVVALVLLVACTNVANLALARNASRERELSVRRALGAGRLRLLQQLLTESVLLALTGGAFGLLLANWGTKGLVGMLSATLKVPRIETTHIDGSVLAFTFGVSIVTGILFGVLPALLAAPRDAAATLREAGRSVAGSATGRRTRATLVVVETALALVLLAGAGVLLKGLVVLRSTATGFATANLVAAEIQLPRARFKDPAARWQFFSGVLDAATRIPGVTAAGLVSSLPFSGGADSLQFRLAGRPEARPVSADFNVVSPGYFRAMQVPILRGREFDRREAQPVVLINETAAHKFWPGEDAVGKRIALPTGDRQTVTLTVVGVTGDIRQSFLSTAPRAEVFLNCLQPGPDWGGFALVVRTSSSAAGVVPAIRTLVGGVDPSVPVARIASMDDVMAGAIAQPQVYTSLLGGFAALALALAAVGLYGVVSYSVAQRTQEIGVRVALGATRGDVMLLILRQGATYSAAGTAIGILGAVAFARVLSTLAPDVLGADPWTFGAVTILLLIVAVAASYIPARRGAAVDPIAALRSE